MGNMPSPPPSLDSLSPHISNSEIQENNASVPIDPKRTMEDLARLEEELKKMPSNLKEITPTQSDNRSILTKPALGLNLDDYKSNPITLDITTSNPGEFTIENPDQVLLNSQITSPKPTSEFKIKGLKPASLPHHNQTSVENADPLQKQEGRMCYVCGASIGMNDKVCSYCGAQLNQ
jgi:hypothetical protein